MSRVRWPDLCRRVSSRYYLWLLYTVADRAPGEEFAQIVRLKILTWRDNDWNLYYLGGGVIFFYVYGTWPVRDKAIIFSNLLERTFSRLKRFSKKKKYLKKSTKENIITKHTFSCLINDDDKLKLYSVVVNELTTRYPHTHPPIITLNRTSKKSVGDDHSSFCKWYFFYNELI